MSRCACEDVLSLGNAFHFRIFPGTTAEVDKTRSIKGESSLTSPGVTRDFAYAPVFCSVCARWGRKIPSVSSSSPPMCDGLRAPLAKRNRTCSHQEHSASFSSRLDRLHLVIVAWLVRRKLGHADGLGQKLAAINVGLVRCVRWCSHMHCVRFDITSIQCFAHVECWCASSAHVRRGTMNTHLWSFWSGPRPNIAEEPKPNPLRTAT